MVDKSTYQGLPYKIKKRKSPHGFLISKIYKFFQKGSVMPYDLVAGSIGEGSALLDIGCGEGDFCYREDLKFKKITGIDVADVRIQKANKRNKNPKKYKFMVADIDEKLPFKTGQFDTVVMVATFQYCYDPFFTLKEVNRVLKKGGVLYIQVTNLAWFVYRLQLLFGKQIFTSMSFMQTWDGGILHYFTYKSLKDLISKNGFKIVNLTCSGIMRKIKLIYPSLLASDIIVRAVKK